MRIKETVEKELISRTFIEKIVAIQEKLTGSMALSIRNGKVYIYVSSRKSPMKTKVFVKTKIDSDKMYEYTRMPQYFIDCFREIQNSVITQRL